MYHFGDMDVFVMYYIYGVFGSSLDLLIESTDSMIVKKLVCIVHETSIVMCHQ